MGDVDKNDSLEDFEWINLLSWRLQTAQFFTGVR